MEKILVEVYVPSLMKSFDIFIPSVSQIGTVLELVKKAVNEITDGMFVPMDNTVLCNFENGKILDINKSVSELEICNGSRLMLI
ncbi:MAG: methyltransferase [Clostridia bacterium]|nr:methyltransferase [Clostridia bacterium]